LQQAVAGRRRSWLLLAHCAGFIRLLGLPTPTPGSGDDRRGRWV